MEVEWDEAKRARNLRNHGVDFARAGRVFEGPWIEAPDSRSYAGEERWLALGHVEGMDLLVVFTWRRTARRIISAWRVGRESQARYQTLLRRAAQTPAGPDTP